jgi:hypothetical protein
MPTAYGLVELVPRQHRDLSQDEISKRRDIDELHWPQTPLHRRSVEIFEKILGTDHPETQDARDILSTSTTPAATIKGIQDSPEESLALDSGWAVEKDGVLELEPESQDAPVQVEVADIAEVSEPSKTSTDPPEASQPAGDWVLW